MNCSLVSVVSLCDIFVYLHMLVLGLVIYDCLDARLVVHVLDALDTFFSKNVIGLFLIFGLHSKEIPHLLDHPQGLVAEVPAKYICGIRRASVVLKCPCRLQSPRKSDHAREVQPAQATKDGTGVPLVSNSCY